MNTQSNRYILSIDPSIAFSGFAILTFEGQIVQFGIITQRQRKLNYPSRALSMGQALREMVSSFHHPISHVVIEMPERWISNRGTAAMDSESVQKLYYAVGGIVFALHTRSCQLWYVEPKRWKGQVPKHLMIRRARRWLDQQNIAIDKITDHEAEAILLGRFAYERIQLDGKSLIQFQEPIKEITQGNCIIKIRGD